MQFVSVGSRKPPEEVAVARTALWKPSLSRKFSMCQLQQQGGMGARSPDTNSNEQTHLRRDGQSDSRDCKCRTLHSSSLGDEMTLAYTPLSESELPNLRRN